MLSAFLWHRWLGVLRGWIYLSLKCMESLHRKNDLCSLHLGYGGCQPVKNCPWVFWLLIHSFFCKHPWSAYHVPSILLDAVKTVENKPFSGGNIQVETQVIQRGQTCNSLGAESSRQREQQSLCGLKRRTVCLEQVSIGGHCI